MIKNVIFDFGGVLLDWNPRYFYRTFFWDENEMEYFLANICTGKWNANHDLGVSYADNIRNLQMEHPEYHNAIGLYREGWSQMLKGDNRDTVAVLHDIHRQGLDLYGLTNFSAETIGEVYERFPYFSLMKGIVVSGQEKMIKPDLRIYELLLRRYALTAEECVFIDDTPKNVAAAMELGIHGIVFRDAARLRKELSALRVLP